MTLSRKPGAVITSIVASAAAQPIGLPPYVPPWLPVRPAVVELSCACRAPANGKPRRDALGHADDVGLDAVVLDGEHLAGAAEAALHLVGDEQDPVLPAALDDARA